MNGKSQIKLKYSVVQQIPFNYYSNDFTFIVNGEKYETNRFIADLLSMKIRHLHSIDQTIDQYTINTEQQGDFSHFLNLIKFNNYEMTSNELLFFASIIEQLNTTSIEINDDDFSELTNENVFDKIQIHKKFKIFFSKQFQQEIEYISSHFFELKEEQEEKLLNFDISTIEQIFMNDHFQLKTEDQLINFINKLYIKNHQASTLYGYVIFANLSCECIKQFLQEFDRNDLTDEMWKSICFRLQQEIINLNDENNNKRYLSNQRTNNMNDKGIQISYNKNNQLDGIINSLLKKNDGNIQDVIKITASAEGNPNSCTLINIIKYNETDKYTYTENEPNSWICIEFVKNRIIPSHYTIGSVSAHDNHIKSWIIEGSNDNENFDKLDEQVNCNLMNQKSIVQTFPIMAKDKDYRFIRIRQTDKTQGGNNYLNLSAFEFHGTLI